MPIRNGGFVEIDNHLRLNLLRHNIEWLLGAPPALQMLLLLRAHLRVVAPEYFLMLFPVEFKRSRIVLEFSSLRFGIVQPVFVLIWLRLRFLVTKIHLLTEVKSLVSTSLHQLLIVAPQTVEH